MKNRLTRNWIAVGIIWVGALVMTYLNTQTIQQIRDNQTFLESMRMDEVFLKNNFDKITRVLTQRASMHKTIDSLQIELISLKDNLKTRSQKQGLSEFYMESDQTSMRGDRISMELQMSGTYRNLIFWLQAIENEIPYLLVNQVRMAEVKDGDSYRFHVKSDFRFNISADGADAT